MGGHNCSLPEKLSKGPYDQCYVQLRGIRAMKAKTLCDLHSQIYYLNGDGIDGEE